MQNVTIYSTRICPYCVKAKQLLTSKGVDYQEISLDEQPEQRQTMLEKSGGKRTVPQIFIGDTHVGGCDELYALEKEGKLDPLLGNGSKRI